MVPPPRRLLKATLSLKLNLPPSAITGLRWRSLGRQTLCNSHNDSVS